MRSQTHISYAHKYAFELRASICLRYKDTFKELWCQLRTPEQFSQWYSVFSRVASMAKASICAENQVNGLATFKEKYVQPQLRLSIDNLTLHLTGSRKDFFPLVPFLEDANFFAFRLLK